MEAKVWVEAEQATAALVFAGGGRRLEISMTEPVSLAGLISSILGYFGLPPIDPPVLGNDGPWAKMLNQPVLPSLVLASDAAAGKSLAIEAAFVLEPPFSFGGEIDVGPLKIELLPYVKVQAVYIEYDRASGLELKAKVLFLDKPPSARELPAAADDPGQGQIVSYPFPAPVTQKAGDKTFQIKYFGLGQRFGPTVDPNAPDPLRAVITALEEQLTSTDPKTVLTELVQKYYHPDRGWYVGAHIGMRGFEIRFVFSDPVLYGIELTGVSGQYEGLLLEILYQKLGPDLGVYYGTLILPTKYRTVNVGAVAITFPSIAIWIYTNGDFKVSVGWPLGDNSIVIQAAQFMGGGGFYFAKLRSGDNPGTKGNVDYNPVLEFGLAVFWGVGRSVSQGPISAQLSLTVQGTFQGVLAWRALNPATGQPGSISNPPDNYWFAASVGIVGTLQGSVDLAIIKASISIQITATAGVAFQLGYATVVVVSADVEVTASVKVVFFTIHISFSAHFSTSFTLGSGVGTASMDGPQGDLAPFKPPVLDLPIAAIAPATPRQRYIELAAAVAPTQAITLQFVLHPTVTYDANAKGSPFALAELFINAPAPNDPPGNTDFETLVYFFENWLLNSYGPAWSNVLDNLGQGWSPGPADFEEQLTSFLQGFTITFSGADLVASAKQSETSVAAFPMLPPLLITAGTTQVAFAVYSKQPAAQPTPADYPQVIDDYFRELSLSQLAPEGGKRLRDGPLDLELTGKAVADYAFTDYFLLLARELAHEMTSGQSPANPAAQLAGIGSRFLVNGLRLPVPSASVVPGDVADVATDGLYDLTGQQLSVAAGTPLQATLSVNPNAASETPGWQIAFAGGGSSTVATAPAPPATAPPAPNPNWTAGAAEAVAADASLLQPLAPLHPAPLWYGARTQIAWTSEPAGAAFVPLPDPLLGLAAAQAPAVTASTQPPDASGKAPTVNTAPALLIRLPITRVRRWSTADVGHGGGADAYLKDVYQLGAADEDTRLLIERLIAAPDALTPATIQLLYPAQGGFASDAEPPFLAKANLSTTNRPSLLTWPRPFLTRLAALGAADLGPVSAGVATAADRGAFLRLVWECSVTNGSEFYLHCAGIPSHVFVQGDRADVAILVQLGPPAAQTTLESYTNTLTAQTSGGGLFLNVVEHTQALPNYPSGCIGFELVRARPQPDTDPYSEATIAALYTLLQFQIEATAAPSPGAPAFVASGWSQAIGPADDDSSDAYRCVVPIYRFVSHSDQGAASVEPSRYAPIGGTPKLAFLLEDVFGNELLCYPHSQSFPVLYSDPLVPVDQWPGVHLAWDVAANSGQVELTVTASFEIGDVLGRDQVVIATPAPGSTVATPSIPVSGTVCNTADSVTVTVGQGTAQPVAVDPKSGEWAAASIELAPGTNTITVVATAPDKTTVSSTVTVTYSLTSAVADAGPPTTAVDTFATRAATALARYAAIVDQLADPGTSLELTTTLAPPPVAITSPSADAALEGAQVTVRGLVQDPSAKVVVNGVSATVEEDGSFAAPDIPLTPGQAVLNAVATPPSGPAVSASVRVWQRQGTSVATTLAPPGESGVVTSGEALRGPLAKLVSDLVEQLKAVAGGGTAVPVAAQTISASLPLDALRDRIDDVFAVGVYLFLSRPSNIDPSAAGELPSIASIASNVPAPATAAFAAAFEKAFTGFDGGDGLLKLAARPQPAGPSVGVPQLWAMRWSATAGVLVDFRNGSPTAAEPVYFAPKPLSRTLVGGPVQVPVYDADLHRSYETHTYNDVDLDVWAQGFLTDFENLLSPSMAVAIASLDSATFANLMSSKADLAEAISKWIAPVYADQAGQGNPTDAEQQFEQALLTSLSADYGTGAIVQRPVWISVAGAAEEDAGLPPRLFGAVQPPPLWIKTPKDGAIVSSSPVTVSGGVDSTATSVTVNGVEATLANGNFTASVALKSGSNEIEAIAYRNKEAIAQAAVQVTFDAALTETAPDSSSALYTFTSAQLPLINSSDPQYLTFLASTAQSLATLEIPLTYNAGFLDHHFQVADRAFGYTPSSWLKFASAGAGSQFDFALGTLRIPLPLRQYPPLPVLIDQRATDPPASSTGGVVIASPTSGTIINANSVRVSGRLPGPNLSVMVNNVPAHVFQADDATWFSVDALPLDQGESTITATARDGGGTVVGSSTVTVYDVSGLSLLDALNTVLRWNYQATVRPSQDPHDELVVEVAWNGPLSEKRLAQPLDAAQTLFQALACFRSAFAGLKPFVEAAPELAFSPTTAISKQQCIEALKATAALISDVAAASSRHQTTLLATAATAAQWSSDFVVQFDHVEDGKLVVLRRESTGDQTPWPTINGKPPDDAALADLTARPSPALTEGTWVTKSYPYEKAAELVLVWPDLPVLEVQNASARFQTIRNADLGDGRKVDDAFIFTTPVVRFATPAVPFISASGLGPFPSQQTLAETLSQLYRPLLSIDAAVERVLRTDIDYAWKVAVDGAGSSLLSRAPITLVPGLTIGPSSGDEQDDPIAVFLTQLAAAVQTWLASRTAAGHDDFLFVDAVLFGTLNGIETPLLQLSDVEFSLSPSLVSGG
jgi:glucodextranase-like protein